MSDDFEFVLSCNLREDLPPKVEKALVLMHLGGDEEIECKHSFFEKDRRAYFLKDVFVLDDSNLFIRQHYGKKGTEFFLDWIRPYVHSSAMFRSDSTIGYCRGLINKDIYRWGQLHEVPEGMKEIARGKILNIYMDKNENPRRNESSDVILYDCCGCCIFKDGHYYLIPPITATVIIKQVGIFAATDKGWEKK
jgi:hypothetical protein